MTALARDIPLAIEVDEEKEYPVVDNDILYKHSICNLNASGHAKPAEDAASEYFGGVALERVDNTLAGHTAGGKKIRLAIRGRAWFAADAGLAAIANIGKVAYVADDQTVDAKGDTTNDVPVGTIKGISNSRDPQQRSNCVYVEFGYGPGIPGDIT